MTDARTEHNYCEGYAKALDDIELFARERMVQSLEEVLELLNDVRWEVGLDETGPIAY